jgi:hypothetical protein
MSNRYLSARVLRNEDDWLAKDEVRYAGEWKP